ncbi:MAG: LAGLIDADG family homing endonuclease [Candidatus Woesebacteria bacterium]|jgi:hypothetical protein
MSKRVPENTDWYIAGFVDGEGSFNVSLRKKSDYNIRWQPVLSFNVSQREITVLEIMKKRFGCGIIKRRRDGLHSYDVTKPRDIKEKIIPFFDKYEFLSENKMQNYLIFKQTVDIMVEKKHLEPEGFSDLLLLREKLNKGKGRKRKYTLRTVLESSETIRQASQK